MEDRLKIRLDLWQLEVFCAVAELRCFSRAAEALYVSQSTVTSHISSLEKRLGVKLFDRTTRKVTLTPAGKLFYKHAKDLLVGHERALQELSRFQCGLAGELIFGASAVPAHYLLPALMTKFQREFPETQLFMRVGSSEQILSGVLDGGLEMGVIGFRASEPRLKVIPLWSDEIILITPPGHEWAERSFVPISKLSGQPFIFREEGSGTRKIFEQFLLQHDFSPRRLKIIAEVGDTETLKRFVAAGGGVGFASIRAVRCEVERGQLKVVRFQEGLITRQFFVALPADRVVSPLCDTFVKFLKEHV